MYYKKINQHKDFEQYTDLPVGTADNTTPTVDAFRFHNTLKAIQMTKVSTDKALGVKVRLGLLRIGDVVEVDLEYLSHTGLLTVAIDNFTDNTYETNQSYGIVSNARFVTFGASSTFKNKTVKFIVVEEGYGLLSVGMRAADASNIYLRNLTIKSTANPIGLPILTKNTRDYIINYNKTTNTFTANDGYTKDAIGTVTITTDRVTIQHAVPFTANIWTNVVGGLAHNTALTNIGVGFKSQARGQFSFTFYDKTTGATIDHTTLMSLSWTGNIFLHVHVIGYDYSY